MRPPDAIATSELRKPTLVGAASTQRRPGRAALGCAGLGSLALALAASCTSFGSGQVPSSDASDVPDVVAPPPREAAADDDVAVPDAAANPDAADSAPRCLWDQPFDTETSVFGPDAGTGFNAPRLTDDELNLVFQRYEEPQFVLYEVARDSTAKPFGSASPIAAIPGSLGGNGGPVISPDGRTLLFNNGAGMILRATRPTRSAPFSGAAAVPGLNGVAPNIHPFVAYDGSEAVWASSRTGNQQIFSAPKAGDGFGSPTERTSVSSTATDWLPMLSRDRLTLYLSSDREGSFSIFFAHRSSTASDFASPQRLQGTGSGESPGWLSSDDCRFYFVRNGAILLATRSPGK